MYLADFPRKDGKTGDISFIKLISSDEYEIIKTNAGIIDYETGKINLFPVNISRTSKLSGEDFIIEISAIPKSNDIIGKQDLYLQIDINKSIINMISDRISSGSDISGTNYIVTSSYTNGDFARI